MSDIFDYIEDPVARRLAVALAKLMETKTVDDISTSELIRMAGVSRSTFYRKYTDKYDLLNKNYQYLLNSTVDKMPEGLSYKKAFYVLYGLIASCPVFFKNALSSRDANCLRNYIFQHMYTLYSDILRKQGFDMDHAYGQMLLYGYISGSLDVTVRWAEEGMKMSIDEMFKISYQLMPDEMKSCFYLYYN